VDEEKVKMRENKGIDSLGSLTTLPINKMAQRSQVFNSLINELRCWTFRMMDS
jgi:hypothetical protein